MEAPPLTDQIEGHIKGILSPLLRQIGQPSTLDGRIGSEPPELNRLGPGTSGQVLHHGLTDARGRDGIVEARHQGVRPARLGPAR